VHLLLLGLNMFSVSINIPTFRFSHSKSFLQFLVPIKFSIMTFSPYFEVNFCIFFNEIMQKCVVLCKKNS